MTRYTIGIYSQGQQRGVVGIYPSTQAAMADAQKLADKMAGRARVQIEQIPARQNHHLIPGERAKYSAPLVARDPTLRDERLTVVEVTPDGYTVTAEGFEDLPPAHVADREVVAADSTSRSWPGDSYEGTAPRSNPVKRAAPVTSPPGIWPGNLDPAQAPTRGDRVSVYLNLTAIYRQTYGAIREGVTRDEAREARAVMAAQAAAQEAAGECKRTIPNLAAIVGMSRSGGVFSVQYPPGGTNPVRAHARAVQLQNAIFASDAKLVRRIREKRKKTPCCMGIGFLVAHGEEATANLAAEIEKRGPGAIVIAGINPLVHDRFTIFYAGATSGARKGDELISAEIAFFVDNPRAKIGAPPAAVYAFGLNAVEGARLPAGRIYTESCTSEPIEGVIDGRTALRSNPAMRATARRKSEWLRAGLQSPRISDRVAYYEQLDDDQIRSALAHIEKHHADRYGDVPFWASQVISFLEEIEGTPRTRRNPRRVAWWELGAGVGR